MTMWSLGCVFSAATIVMDKIRKEHINKLAEEFDIPIEQVELIINTQHSDIKKILKDRGDISFILLKGLGTFSIHEKKRRPFRSDKYTQHEHKD